MSTLEHSGKVQGISKRKIIKLLKMFKAYNMSQRDEIRQLHQSIIEAINQLFAKGIRTVI